jgi:release factor glutamine methyltransferase
MTADVNPKAIACAHKNAERNGVADRITFALGDVFDGVDGDFDLIVFDPPFPWFKPRDLLEAGSTDDNDRALTRFIAQVKGRLRPNGRVLLNFGTTADIDYLYSLIRNADEAGAAPLRRGNQGWVYGPPLRHQADGLTLGSPLGYALHGPTMNRW